MHTKPINELLEQNKAWATSQLDNDPEFFSALADGQKPEFLWIGCSDSRVPATQIVGLKPGEMFVHRNIANLVPHSDLSSRSVIQFAVEALGVSHIIVAGHYSCGGVRTALSNANLGTIDNWLAHIKDVYREHYDEICAIEGEDQQADRLSELNVMAQVRNVAKTDSVQNAWKQGKSLKVHGWIYGLNDGILHDLGLSIDAPDQLHQAFRF